MFVKNITKFKQDKKKCSKSSFEDKNITMYL
jgi:hypothetical protein